MQLLLRNRRPALALVAVLAVAGCAAPTTMRQSVDPALAAKEAATQRKLVLERQFKDLIHLQSVARPLLRGSAALCGEHVTPSVGVFAANAYDFQGDYQQSAREYGLGESVTVIAVIDHTPAASAGLQARDELLAADGWPVPSGNKATSAFVEHMRGQLRKAGSMTLTVSRAGQKLDLAMQAEPICDYNVMVDGSDAVNAYADGKSVYIAQGMLRFVETDQELSLVIGHELAHNAMGHIRAKRVNSAIGTVFDILAGVYGVNTGGALGQAGAQAYSQAFESEADYVGLYAMARADVPIDGAANFWRRMGVNSGGIKTQYSSTHPGSAERFLAIENAIVEIHAKQAAGERLLPNIKGKTAPAAVSVGTGTAAAASAPAPPPKP